MSTLTATAHAQSSEAAWKRSRVGRFTASTIGDLFTEPRSLTPAQKLRKAEGFPVFGDTALALIASKACERIAGVEEWSAMTKSMERGMELEPVAKVILSRVWKPIEGTTWMPHGDNSGATPDGLVEKGTEPLDVKCPEKFSDVMRFGLEVPDMDFDALLSWNKRYAWQVMHQAKCAGAQFGNLVYFTDRLPLIIEIDGQQLQDWLNDRTGGYLLESNGIAYTARRFELTQERSEKIDRVLYAAEEECVEMEQAFRKAA